MENGRILEVLNNLNKHIVFDKNINAICYSAELVKCLSEIKNRLKEGEK